MDTIIQQSIRVPGPSTNGAGKTPQHGSFIRKLFPYWSRRAAQPLTTDAIYEALWENDPLRCLEYGNVTVAIDGNTAILSGHVTAAHTRRWAEEIVSQVPGVEAVENHLVDDDELVVEVCQALAENPRTEKEIILVAVRHGLVVLSGTVQSATTRDVAEACAASVAQVRGVSNYIEAPGVVAQAEEEQLLQPHMREEVMATDMSLGRVGSVIISPHNRDVTSFVAQGAFPYHVSQRRPFDWDRYDVPKLKRSVVIPRQAIEEITPTAVWLRVSAAEAAGYPDFDPACFRMPANGWQPPYPYQTADVWLDTHTG